MRTLRKTDVAEEAELPEGEPDARGYRSALELASRAFGLIREFKTPPIPKAYEVLYSYVSSDRALVKVRVDEAVKRDGVLNLYDVDQIHADFFSYPEAIHTRHDETAGNMDAELDTLLSLISDQVGASGKYSQSLEAAGASLSNGVTVQVLRSTIKVLLSENHRVREQSREIATQLESSREVIKTIKKNLASAREEGLRDALTGLRNRRHFDRVLPHEIERAGENGTALSLCILDIDHFKSVNDRFGHPTGDAVLRVIGSLLSENLKGRDVPVRYGGEEFATLLPMTELSAAERLADRIRTQISEKRLVLTEGQEPIGKITASFGVAQWCPNEDEAELIARADAMLYKAKNNGRNRVECDVDNVPD